MSLFSLKCSDDVQVKLWFKKAASDLKAARLLKDIEDDGENYFSGFACQQCIEKSIKGFLAFHKSRFSKTHDLVSLRTQALEINSDLKSLNIGMKRITEFAVTYRYPDAELEPITQAELEETLIQARAVFDELSKICLGSTPLEEIT